MSHARVAALAYACAMKIVEVAIKSRLEDINAVLDRAKPAHAADGSAPATTRSSAGHEDKDSILLSFRIPRPHDGVVHAKDYVEALIAIVHTAPWATRSRELRAMLGVKKDPFLRIVDAALATGRPRAGRG